MARCRTDCIERALRICFEMMGHFIGSYPWWFLITPLIVSTSLGSGFYFIKDRMSNVIEEQFTPVDGPAKMERKYIEETFPRNDSAFSSLRLSTDGNYATLIATNDRNILTVESLHDILRLDSEVRNMAVQLDNQTFRYVDVCAETAGSCTSNDILDIIENNATNIDTVNLTYPWYHSDFRSIPLYLSLGSVKLKQESSVVESAKAVQLRYYLEEDNKMKTDLWLEGFIYLLSNESSPSIQVSKTHRTTVPEYCPIMSAMFNQVSLSRSHTPPQCQCSGNLINLHLLSSIYSLSPTLSPSCFHF